MCEWQFNFVFKSHIIMLTNILTTTLIPLFKSLLDL